MVFGVFPGQYAVSPSSGAKVNLRLDWGDVQKVLEQGAGANTSSAHHVQEDGVLRNYSKENLDPTQRAFTDRVLKRLAEIEHVYKEVSQPFWGPWGETLP